MVSRADLIAEARTWDGTPWRHQGRLKGVGCDCVGVMICAPRALGLFAPDFDITGYSRNPQPAVMLGYLNMHVDRVAPGQQRGGDLLLLMPKRIPQHLALLTFDGKMIHAIDERRGVREHVLDTRRYPIASVWRYRGLAD